MLAVPDPAAVVASAALSRIPDTTHEMFDLSKKIADGGSLNEKEIVRLKTLFDSESDGSPERVAAEQLAGGYSMQAALDTYVKAVKAAPQQTAIVAGLPESVAELTGADVIDLVNVGPSTMISVPVVEALNRAAGKVADIWPHVQATASWRHDGALVWESPELHSLHLALVAELRGLGVECGAEPWLPRTVTASAATGFRASVDQLRVVHMGQSTVHVLDAAQPAMRIRPTTIKVNPLEGIVRQALDLEWMHAAAVQAAVQLTWNQSRVKLEKLAKHMNRPEFDDVSPAEAFAALSDSQRAAIDVEKAVTPIIDVGCEAWKDATRSYMARTGSVVGNTLQVNGPTPETLDGHLDAAADVLRSYMLTEMSKPKLKSSPSATSLRRYCVHAVTGKKKYRTGSGFPAGLASYAVELAGLASGDLADIYQPESPVTDLDSLIAGLSFNLYPGYLAASGVCDHTGEEVSSPNARCGCGWVLDSSNRLT